MRLEESRRVLHWSCACLRRCHWMSRSSSWIAGSSGSLEERNPSSLGLSLRWRVTQRQGKGCSSPWHNHRAIWCFLASPRIRRKTFFLAELELVEGSQQISSQTLPWISPSRPCGSLYRNWQSAVRAGVTEEGNGYRKVGRSRFATANCELLIAPSIASPLVAALSPPVLENQEGWWAFNLISMVL